MSAHQRADPSRKLYFGVGLRFVAMINRAHCHGDACLQLTRGFCIGCFTRSFRDARGVGLAVCLPVRSRPWRVPLFFSLLRFDFVCCFVFRGGAYRREGGRSYYCKKKRRGEGSFCRFLCSSATPVYGNAVSFGLPFPLARAAVDLGHTC